MKHKTCRYRQKDWGIRNIKVLILSAFYSRGEIRSINIYCNYRQTELQENISANSQSVYSKIKSNKQWLRSVGITVYTTSIVILVSMYWQNWSIYLTNDTRRQTQYSWWLAEGTVKFTLPHTTEMNFATSQILVVNSIMFQHQNFHKNTRTSLAGKTHNHHILIERWQLSALDVWSFSGADWYWSLSGCCWN